MPLIVRKSYEMRILKIEEWNTLSPMSLLKEGVSAFL